MVGYAPGMPPTRFADDAAMLVPKGSKLLFQMHYTPNGTAQEDRSMLGIVFADPSSVKQRVDGSAAVNVTLQIPPGDGNFESQAQYKFNRDVTLCSLMPHMHVRGKSFRYEIQYPDGNREVLLDVPHYDFNWQNRYELAEPKAIPNGSTMICTAHYDNSADNPANPDPTKLVKWGDQTWDEMLVGYFSTIGSKESASPIVPKAQPVVALDDDASRQKAAELLKQGVDALGGEKLLAENPVVKFKLKGTLYMNQAPLAFTGETTIAPTESKINTFINGLVFTFIMVLDGEHAWLKINDRLIELPHEGVEEQRERMYFESVSLLYPILQHDDYELLLIQDAKVGKNPADGVVVHKTGHRDVRLYFDPQSHRLIKTETIITENGRDIAQEVLLENYAEFGGVQRAQKALVRWDGADRIEREMSEFKATPTADADAFAKP